MPASAHVGVGIVVRYFEGTELANAGLLLAIAALGLTTSLTAIVGRGWRHITTIVGATIVLLAIVAGGLVLVPVG